MIDHMAFRVSDYARSKRFYAEALACLGITLLVEVTAEQSGGSAYAGFGSQGRPYFWFGEGASPPGRLHVAFAAGSREEVDVFYRSALAAGATDNGAPGLRAHYHPDYYGAFVLDPDGINVEAVCRRPA